MIGLGEEKGGLYFLQDQSSASDLALPTTINKSVSIFSANKVVNNRSFNLDLWHYRLGHPSFTIFKFLRETHLL